MAGNELEAIMPLTTRGSKESDDLRRAAMLLRSLRARFEGPAPLRIWIATPGGDVEMTRAALARYGGDTLDIAVVDEGDVIPGLGTLDCGGWHRQQLVKLGAPRLSDARWWMTLDADLLCLRRWSPADLIVGGRGKMARSPVLSEMIRGWIHDSAALLCYPRPSARNSMGVTPVLYCRDILEAMWARIEAVYRAPWWIALAARTAPPGWSEQGLYEAVGRHEEMIACCHVVRTAESGGGLTDRRSLFDAKDLDADRLEAAFFDGRAGYFVVCSSYLVTTDSLEAVVEPLLDRAAI